MTLDITTGVIRKGFREVSSLELQACNTSLNNDECRESYFEILNEYKNNHISTFMFYHRL